MTAQQLRNSILQMAVQGKLVPQDPTDEPASVLLERIRAEKERLIKEGKIKREKNPSVIFRGADNLPYEKVGNAEPVCIADEVPFEVPDSWEWVRIGSLLNLQAGKSISSSDIYQENDGSMFPCFGGNGTRGYAKTWNREGDYPIIGRQGALCGNVNYAEGRFYATEHAVVVEHFSNTDTNWLCCFLQALNLNQYATATAQPGLAVSTINTVLIPLPPVAEQKRIIHMIEAVSTNVEEYGLANKRLANLNTLFPSELKKSILQMAVQGKLVPQDSADEPAEALLARIRKQKEQLIKEGKIKRDKHESVIFIRDNSHYEMVDGVERCIDEEIPFEAPESWMWARLRSICKEIVDCPHSTPEYLDYTTDYWAIDTNCISSDGSIVRKRFVNRETYNDRVSRLVPKEYDIVMTREGTIGRAAVLPPNSKICLGQRVMLLRPAVQALSEYIRLIIFSDMFLNQLSNNKRGIGAKHVNVSDVCNALLPLPPLKEQQRIIDQYSYIKEKFSELSMR